MGVTCIFILVFFKFFDRFWRPWRHVRSFGPLFVCIIGLAAVYIGQVHEASIELTGCSSILSLGLESHQRLHLTLVRWTQSTEVGWPLWGPSLLVSLHGPLTCGASTI